MRLYSWTLRYGTATAMANNLREARKLVLRAGIDNYDVEAVRKTKPNVNTSEPHAVNTFQ